MNKTLTCSIFFLVVLNLNVSSLILFDPKDDEKRARRVYGGSAIPLEKGEKLVLYDPKYHRAIWVVVLVKSPYEKARHELRDIVSERIGIVSEAEISDRDVGIFPEREPVPKGFDRWLLFGKGFVKFRAIGVRMDQPKEYQIKSRRYNEVKELSGSSELRLRMADGKTLFGKDCALIVMSRIDYTRQYPRYYDIPLPFRVSMEEDVVTDTEIKLIENFTARLGNVKPRYFVPPDLGLKDEEYWVDFMRTIKDAAKNF